MDEEIKRDYVYERKPVDMIAYPLDCVPTKKGKELRREMKGENPCSKRLKGLQG
jgi:hypothetical protein